MTKQELEEAVEDFRFELTAPKIKYESPNQDLLKMRLDIALENSFLEGVEKITLDIVQRAFDLGYSFDDVKKISGLTSLRLRKVMEKLGIEYKS